MINLSLLSAPYYYLHLTRATSTPQVSMLEVQSAWNNYTLATRLDKEEEANQVATLLAVIGKEANKVFGTFTFSSPEDAKKIESVLRKFKEYCIPRENTIYKRFPFFTRDQRESENSTCNPLPSTCNPLPSTLDQKVGSIIMLIILTTIKSQSL